MAGTTVRGLVVAPIRRLTTFDFFITVPCDFNTPISVFVGGSSVIITLQTFKHSSTSFDSTRCMAGAFSESSLTGGRLASTNIPEDKEFWILGDVFLRNAYTAWDFGNGYFGFTTQR